MAPDPLQRKEISIERLKMLRTNLREAYKKSRGEELPNANNKYNPFYKTLSDDILEHGDRLISLGTIHKFLYDDENRTYQIIIIQTIEKYISVVMRRNTQEKGSEVVDSKTSENKNSPEIKMFANRVYIELKTRKAAIPIDEDNDVIEEIYDSWYKLFCLLRDELKVLPANFLDDIENPESPVGLAMKILNDVLRPHLTEHQAKFRNWFQYAKRNPKNKNITPQELQKKYPDYNSLLKSMKEVNKRIIEDAKEFSRFP